MELEPVIGLEVHAELSTDSKMFCGCSTEFGGEPNTRTCPVCLGLPGVLPVINRRAVEYGIRLALALNCKIKSKSLFHRKNYFYPDMPKDFQISQYDVPLSVEGFLEVDMGDYVRRVGITRVHLEEDTGKSIHVGESGRIHAAEYSLEDFNRAGIPLVEIVSEPDIQSPEEARAYMQLLKSILEQLGVSDCKMEEGSLRCDGNVSVRLAGGSLGTKVEIKNMNSFRALQRALSYEVERQRELLEASGTLKQETRHWDDAAGITHPLRSKEEAFDYRYFPEPDLVPLEPDPGWVKEIESTLPELPQARGSRLISEFGLSRKEAALLSNNRSLGDYFEKVIEFHNDVRAACNWVTGDLLYLFNQSDVSPEDSALTPEGLAEMLDLIADGTISGKMAKEVLKQSFETGEKPGAVVEKAGMAQMSDAEELEKIVEEVISTNPKSVEDIRSGKEQALKFLIGQVMKMTKGKANPKLTNEILREKLDI